MGLTHKDVIVDVDAKCIINIETKKIETLSSKTGLAQYDHNSERIGFTMPRKIDEHDMSTVDRIAIKYLNVNKADMYIVDDMSITEDGNHITFTWLVSGNATKEVGSLIFAINFRCWNDSGAITYNWTTHPCSTYSIFKGVPSMDSNPDELYDFWARYNSLVRDTTERVDILQEKTEVLTDNANKLEDNLNKSISKSNDLTIRVDTLEQNVPVLETKVDSLNELIPDIESRVKVVENTLSDDQAFIINQEIEVINTEINKINNTKIREIDSTFFKDSYNILDNIVDKTNVGFQLNNSTGELYEASSCSVTDYIPVDENTLYHAFGITIHNAYSDFANRCVFYDSDKKYLSYVNDVTKRYFTTPEGCRYIRISQGSSDGVELHNVYVGTKEADLRLYIKDNHEFEYVEKSIIERTSYNLFDKTKSVVGYRNSKTVLYGYAYSDEECLVVTDGYFVSDYIPVESGDVMHIGYYANGAFHHISSTQRVITGYDAKKRILFRREGTGEPYEIGEQVAYIRFYDSNVYSDVYMVVKNKVPTEYVPYIEKVICGNEELVRKGESDMVNHWMGKTCVTYGDSITAQGNFEDSGYQYFMNQKIHFANMYNRGVGGQTFVWNSDTFYANSDGSYNSRDDKHSPPDGTTEHNGSFCSWDRITTMIPAAIRETIDLVIVMGGTNDHGQDNVSSEEFVWNSENVTDTDWVKDSEFYNGGDYDVMSFTGAIASTIMKLQTWCPNAVIVIATPFCKWDTSTDKQYLDSFNRSMTDVSVIEMKVAKHMSVPIIDVNGTCCVNAFNYVDFVRDGVHPSTNGEKRLARAVVSGLTTIYPMIE